MKNSHIYRQVARLHAASIERGFLSSLGTPFLALLYEAIDANESSVLLTAWHQGEVVGFVAGTDGMRSIYRQLLLRWPRLFAALLTTMSSPTKLSKIAEILLLSKKSLPNLPRAELLSIAVAHGHRGQGYARSLYQGLVDDFCRRGVYSFRIVVGKDLATARRFYNEMGATPELELEVHRGQTSVMYVHRCH